MVNFYRHTNIPFTNKIGGNLIMTYFFQKGTNKQLIVAFHGTGGNQYQLLTTTAALFPEASLVSFLGNVGEAENRRFFAPTNNGQLDRTEFDGRTLEFIENEWPQIEKSDYEEIIFIGYSNGANFILGLLEKNPKIADSLILLHPSNLSYQFIGKTDVPRILLTTGSQDEISLAGDLVQLEKQLKNHFTDVQLLIVDGGHGLEAEEIARLKQAIK